MRGILLVIALAMLGVAPAGAAVDPTRSLEVLDLRLETGEALGIGLHPSPLPIEVDSSQPNLEVCPAGWISAAGFDDCLSLDADGHLVLPSTVLASMHLGIRIQGIDGAPVRAKRVRVTYEPEDGYFMFEPPVVAPGGRTPTLIVTPEDSTSIGLGPYHLRGSDSENATTSMKPVVRQGSKRIKQGGAQLSGRAEKTFGPVKLGKQVRIVVRNPSDEDREVAFLVEWD